MSAVASGQAVLWIVKVDNFSRVCYCRHMATTLNSGETRSIRVSGRVSPSLDVIIRKIVKKNKWSYSDAIEIGLELFTRKYPIR